MLRWSTTRINHHHDEYEIERIMGRHMALHVQREMCRVKMMVHQWTHEDPRWHTFETLYTGTWMADPPSCGKRRKDQA